MRRQNRLTHRQHVPYTVRIEPAAGEPFSSSPAFPAFPEHPPEPFRQ
jgi:hypothetical protein